MNQWSIDSLADIIDINISESNMLATIKLGIDQPIDSPFPVEAMKLFLESNNIIFGVNERLLKEICARPMDYIGNEVEIAVGLQPIDGMDSRIEWVISQEKDQKPKELKDGRVDYYSVNQVVNINKGQLIAQKTPFTFGEPGKTVLGKEFPQKKGKDIQIKPGKNVVLNDNRDKIYAVLDGQLVITEQSKINIFPIYEVNGDVDFGIGNIDFVGTVVIRGNVPDGFKINASGDIKVYGNVEGAELNSGGSIFIQQGIIGHNNSSVKANKSIKASFILNGNVSANDTVEVSQSIMHSTVRAGKKVICKGLKGLIVGGKIQAGTELIASSIGNQLHTTTTIEVGINPELRIELNKVRKEKMQLITSLDKVNKGINLLDRIQQVEGSLAPDKKKMQIQLLNQKLASEKKIKPLEKREKEIEKEFEEIGNSEIDVLKAIYPGVKLIIGNVTKFINKEYKYMKFVLDEGDIVAKSL